MGGERNDGVVLVGAMFVPDSDGTGNFIRVTNECRITYWQGEGEANHALLHMLYEMAQHEIQESVRLNGALVLDPHADELPQP